MNYENVLLIGGPKDGTRISVLEGVPRIQFASASHESASSSTPTEVDVQLVVYRREQMHSSMGFKGAIYVLDNGFDALPTLIEGYRGSRDSFEALARVRGYNTDQDEAGYVSKITTELYEFWRGGRK